MALAKLSKKIRAKALRNFRYPFLAKALAPILTAVPYLKGWDNLKSTLFREDP